MPPVGQPSELSADDYSEIGHNLQKVFHDNLIEYCRIFFHYTSQFSVH